MSSPVICTHMSTNPENLVTIGSVHSQMIGLQWGMIKNKKKNGSRICNLCSRQTGGL